MVWSVAFGRWCIRSGESQRERKNEKPLKKHKVRRVVREITYTHVLQVLSNKIIKNLPLILFLSLISSFFLLRELILAFFFITGVDIED